MKKPWDLNHLINTFESHRNELNAVPMAAYMKGNFHFLGLRSPLRKQLLKEYFSEYTPPEPKHLFENVWKLYQLPEREYHYLAIALIEKLKKHLTPDDLPVFLQLIETNSWWDSVDSIAPNAVGRIIKMDRENGENVMREWSQSDNMWTNRSAILHQLKFKQDTNANFLFEIINQHTHSNEFFIQKAIGWALREYAKTDPAVVLSFTEEHALKPLSKREALKHLK
ncbi:DNA alkylation repair protein [Sporosarcina sp. CAU 1771]